MWIADQWQDYELLDCGGGEKLERWDKQYLVRPDPQAIWETPRRLPEWKRANARYLRSQIGGGIGNNTDHGSNSFMGVRQRRMLLTIQ